MDGSFLIRGVDLVGNPSVSYTPGVGTDLAGQVTLTAGTQIFPDSYIIEFVGIEYDAQGEAVAGTRITDIRVFASQTDYDASNVLYTYAAATPADHIEFSFDAADMGDTYIGLDASTLNSADVGAPALTDLFLAPGTDVADTIGTLNIDHFTAIDFNDNGVVMGGTAEPASGQFNLLYPDFAYNGPRNDFVVEGTSGDDVIGDGYVGDPEGDMIDNTDAADRSNDDVVDAGAGNDSIDAWFGNDSVIGGEGDDTFNGFEGNDSFDGGIGADSFVAGEGHDVFIAGDGDDYMTGQDGNDYFEGGIGDDIAHGDSGNDTLFGGAGNDYLRGSYGSDSVSGGTGDDFTWTGYNDDTISLENDFGNDTIILGEDDEVVGDTLDFTAVTDDLTFDLSDAIDGQGTVTDGTFTANFTGAEHILLGSGTNTIALSDGSGADTVNGFAGPVQQPDGSYLGTDQLDVSGMRDEVGRLVDTGDIRVTDDGAGNAVLGFPGSESLTLLGVAPADLDSEAALAAIGIPLPNLDGVVEGDDDNNVIDGTYDLDPEGDVIDGGDATDPSNAPNDDVVRAGGGNDTVRSGEGSDTIFGGAGDDMLQGNAGDDELMGDAGADLMQGGEGDDTLNIGIGDTGLGEDGDDTFVVDETQLGGGYFYAGGGEGAESGGDTLIYSGDARLTMDAFDSEAGTIEWSDGSVLEFWEIENIQRIPCFTPGTLIATPRGKIPVQHLQQNDRVLTRDNGFQPIAWVGRRHVSLQEMMHSPSLQPVLIRKDALGKGAPDRDMLVSPQHRMLLADPKVALWFGESEVFVPAVHLTCLDGVEQVTQEVTYVHFMFEIHQVVQGDAAWSESFQPGDMTLAGMDDPQRKEILALFPELRNGRATETYPAARSTLTGQETRVLFS